MDTDVPMIVPEINDSHTDVIAAQKNVSVQQEVLLQ